MLILLLFLLMFYGSVKRIDRFSLALNDYFKARSGKVIEVFRDEISKRKS